MANQHSNPGNFANDREKASQAGQKGGQHSSGSHKSGSHAADKKSETHGGGNFADDRQKASEAGRKGGSH